MDNEEKQPLRVAQILGKMNGGGVEQVVMNYMRAIDRDKIGFDLFMFKSSKYVPTDEIKSLGGRIYALCGFSHPFRYVRTLTEQLRNSGCSVVHCHLGTMSFLPLLAAKKAGIPVRILHIHITSGGIRELFRNAAKHLLKAPAAMYATHKAACSEKAAHYMYGALPIAEIDDTDAPKGSAVIIKNAVDTDYYKYNEKKRNKFRGEFGISSKTLLFGHAGRFCPVKNQSFLIDIFARIVDQHKNSRLILAGTGSDMELIKARVISAGLSGKVIFAGQRSDMDGFYSAVDCFILPSHYEGLGISGIEAQCAGVYCLFSDKVPIEAKITDSAQYLSLRTPASDWACAALCCAKLRNPSAAEQVKAAGYDIHSQAELLTEYYLRLAEKK